MLSLALRPWLSLTASLLFFSLLLVQNTLAASITAEPAQGPAGTSVTVRGTAWPPGDLIEFLWHFNYQLPVASVHSDNSGNFTTTVAVPQGAPPGPTYIDAGDQAAFRTAQAKFTVTGSGPTLTTDCAHLTVPWVALYQDVNFGGRVLCFEGTGLANLADYGFDKQTRSINIAASGVFFDQSGGLGNQVAFYLGERQATLGTWDRQISSFRVGPFARPTSGYMGWGWTGDAGHRGIDVWTGSSSGCNCSEASGCNTAPGNEVRAAYAGTVEAIYWGDHAGNWRLPNAPNPNGYPLSVVVLKHTNVPGVSGNIYTLYQHLANNTNESYVRADLSIGNTMKQYETIGRQGNWKYYPENALITHLHFEVAFPVDNQPMPTRKTVDPMPYFGLNYASCSGTVITP